MTSSISVIPSIDLKNLKEMVEKDNNDNNTSTSSDRTRSTNTSVTSEEDIMMDMSPEKDSNNNNNNTKKRNVTKMLMMNNNDNNNNINNRSWLSMTSSKKAKRTSNPIRKIVDNLKPSNTDPMKQPLIPLSLGDPCVFGNIPTPEPLMEAIKENVSGGKFNGYTNSMGTMEARTAIAHYANKNSMNRNTNTNTVYQTNYNANDIIITSGCSGALEMVISCFINEGDNLLVPNPGFPLYQVITESIGGEVKPYALDDSSHWECDLQSMEEMIDENTKAIVINNPSNPCGSVFSETHLKEILLIAEKFCLPIIADEIYGDMTFNIDDDDDDDDDNKDNNNNNRVEFIPLASLTTKVPILTVGGLAKQFVVPGWRCGWIMLHDNESEILSHAGIRQGLQALSTIIIGGSTLIQSILPQILTPDTPEVAVSMQSHKEMYFKQIADNTKYCCHRLRACKGLEVITPKGAMYVMIKVDTKQFCNNNNNNIIHDDLSFAQLLLKEENIFVLPGQCFGIKNFFRIVTSPPIDKLKEAMDRIELFCEKHATTTVA